ncbi:hypothetical protein Pres01_35560 [Metapseudomonas resinovorans]|nr:hypothetical protein Pres01_35560 [Pseudomonas resinovorans]
MSPIPSEFDGRVVLVTGGAQGIGQAIVRQFAEAGAQVMIADLRGEQAANLAAALRAEGWQVSAAAVDLTQPEAIATLLQQIESTHGRLDVLVHNAGYFPLTPFSEISPRVLQRTLDVNLSALFWLTQGALPLFTRQGSGCVLVTSSVTGPRVAYPGLTHYAAAKAGVNGFIRAAALELAPLKVRVNGVEPGMIERPPWTISAMHPSTPALPQPCHWDAWVSRAISPRLCAFWPRMGRRTSRDRPLWSTAERRCRR